MLDETLKQAVERIKEHMASYETDGCERIVFNGDYETSVRFPCEDKGGNPNLEAEINDHLTIGEIAQDLKEHMAFHGLDDHRRYMNVTGSPFNVYAQIRVKFVV